VDTLKNELVEPVVLPIVVITSVDVLVGLRLLLFVVEVCFEELVVGLIVLLCEVEDAKTLDVGDLELLVEVFEMLLLVVLSSEDVELAEVELETMVLDLLMMLCRKKVEVEMVEVVASLLLVVLSSREIEVELSTKLLEDARLVGPCPCKSQISLTVAVSKVTLPSSAISAPAKLIAVSAVTEIPARIIPAIFVPAPRVAEDPNAQKTLHGEPSLITTLDPAAVVRVEPI